MTSPEPWVQRFRIGFESDSYGLSWPDGDRGGPRPCRESGTRPDDLPTDPPPTGWCFGAVLQRWKWSGLASRPLLFERSRSVRQCGFMSQPARMGDERERRDRAVDTIIVIDKSTK